MSNRKQNTQSRGDDGNVDRTGESQHVKRGNNTNGSTKGRKNPSRKKHNDQRVQEYRETKCSDTVGEYNEKIKDKWIAGIEDSDKLEARMKETANQKAQMLSVTTRGVGMNLLSSIFTTTSYKSDITAPNIYSLYRLCLAVVEAKVQSLKLYLIPPRFTDKTATLNNSADFERVCHSVVFLPKPIVQLVNSIGIIKQGSTTYIPVFNADYTATRVPTPEMVRFGNLREVVEALANPDTPLIYRRSFYDRNPIPGAKWSNYILTNGDEIMPSNYNTDDLARDSLRATLWMSVVQKHVPKLVGSAISFESTGRKSIFVCNEQESLRLPDRGSDERLEEYYERGIPEGNIRTFHSPYEITVAERLEGQLCLLGERPIYGNFKDPVYVHRLESRCEFEYSADYLSTLQLSFGFKKKYID